MHRSPLFRLLIAEGTLQNVCCFKAAVQKDTHETMGKHREVPNGNKTEGYFVKKKP